MHRFRLIACSSWNGSITGLRFLETVMSTPSESGDRSTQETVMIHCWDPQARRMVCGAPGQIGSTKHVGSVTCNTCLELLGKPLRPVFSLVR